jgi:hypothetical protein
MMPEASGRFKRLPMKLSTAARLAVILLCVAGAAWTCRRLSGHRVASYTFEEALAMVRQGGDNAAACAALRDHVAHAIEALRSSGPNGTIAVRNIAQEAAK